MTIIARVAGIFLALQAWTAQAATDEEGFWSGGKFRKIEVDQNHLAVGGGAGLQQRAAQTTMPQKATEAFANMNVWLIPRSQVQPADAILGYPVWFDREKTAVGILTHEIVVAIDEEAALKSLRQSKGYADHVRARFGEGIYLVKFSSPLQAMQAANTLKGVKGIRYAHPNFMVPKNWRNKARPSSPVGEPLFPSQWHLENTGQSGGTAGADVHIRQAWDITHGSDSVVVAVLDGGFEMTHPDLEGSWYVNRNEIPGNGVDDDRNGYVDDVNGWNYVSGNNNPAGGFLDDHGTCVAGLVGARQNGAGVTGACPQCTILPVVVSWDMAEDAAAFYYAEQAGAHIITNSWGYPVGTPETDVVEEAISTVARRGREGKGTIILFAMNNINQDDCTGNTPDISSLDAVVAVSAASDLDKKVSFSAWGNCMEFLSPSYESGRPGIVTTDLTGTRGYNNGRYPGDLSDLNYTNDFGGTSAATPTAAGIFGLMLSVNGDLTRDEALALVLSTADKVHPDLASYDASTGFSQKYGYGRINAAKAVRAAEVFRKYTQRDKKTPGRSKDTIR